ncbi:MAG: alpha/beta fold hydrolase [Prevotellaceae bacterium]|jgi:dienelactone hydrolase|nr:alpha/beta fold hydrolase [Prevotellaceae bacterium]
MHPHFIYRLLLLCALLTGYVTALFAQREDSCLVAAERAYQYFAAGRGDSLYAMLGKEHQAKASPLLFKEALRQTERQVGKLQSHSPWQRESAQQLTFYYSDLQFERYSFRLLTAFDADGSLSTFRLVPVPAATTAQPVVRDERTTRQRDIVVGADGFQLPGTLTTPVGNRRFPAVILVHGSGPNDRDETIGPNKPFRDLAWGLAARGIASIRYDKRTKVYGAGYVPQGGQANYDTEAVDDAVAIVAWAKAQPELCPDSIYLVGHSLGATLAPRIAGRAEGLAGIILLAALARPLEDALVEQVSYLASLTDASTAQSRQSVEKVKQQAANVKRLGTPAFCDTIGLPLGLPASYFLLANRYQPVVAAAGLSLPILVLQGERDYQVTMQDYGMWRYGLMRKGNVFFKSYPKLNHLFGEGSGQSTPMEYQQPSPLPAYLMEDIATFIHTGRLID